MSNSFQKVQKVDPFCEVTLGTWKPDKKQTSKQYLAFQRSAEVNVPEMYAQDWHDPITSVKKQIWGKVILKEQKLINKETSEESFQRTIDPSPNGGAQIKEIIV
jgi:hypothetical protein